MLAIELVLKRLTHLRRVKLRENIAIVPCPTRDRTGASLYSDRSRSCESLQRGCEAGGAGGIQFAPCLQFPRQPADQHELADVRLDHQRKHVPPVDSEIIHPLAHSELKQLPHVKQVFKVFGKIIQTDDAATRLLAPTLVGSSGRAAKIDDQIPFSARARSLGLVFGMK